MKAKNILVLLMILLSVSIHGFELKKVLEFGSDEAEEYIFYKRGPITVDDEGNIYVIEGETLQLRKYDKLGKFVTKTGGKGQGPGEFQSATSMTIKDGSLLIYDFSSRRLNRFSLDLEYLQSETAHLSFNIAANDDFIIANKRMGYDNKLVLIKPFTNEENDVEDAEILKIKEKHKDSLFLWVYFRNMFAVEEISGAFVSTLHYPIEGGPELAFYDRDGGLVKTTPVRDVVPGYRFDERILYKESIEKARKDFIVIRNLFYINRQMTLLQYQYLHGEGKRVIDNYLMLVDNSSGQHLGKLTLGKELDFFCFKRNKLYGFSFDNEEAEVMIHAYELVLK